MKDILISILRRFYVNVEFLIIQPMKQYEGPSKSSVMH